MEGNKENIYMLKNYITNIKNTADVNTGLDLQSGLLIFFFNLLH